MAKAVVGVGARWPPYFAGPTVGGLLLHSKTRKNCEALQPPFGSPRSLSWIGLVCAEV